MSSTFLAEVADKVPNLLEACIFHGIVAAPVFTIALVARRRLALTVCAVAAALWFVASAAANFSNDPLHAEIVAELGLGYCVRQTFAAGLPLLALATGRLLHGVGIEARADAFRGFPVIPPSGEN